MKKLMVINTDHLFGRFLRSAVVLFIGIALGFVFWTATAPVAKAARDMTPADMIQSKLPTPKTLMSATKPEVLSAVCGAVKKWRTDAAQIARTAAGARKEIAGDIVASAISCLGEHPNCDLTGQIVAAGLAANPDGSANIMELALQSAPDCYAAIERAAGGERGEGGGFTDPPSNQNPPPGTTGAGAGQEKCIVCHNPHNYHEIEIPCDQVDKFLKNHPGDYRGRCQATPPKNR